MNSKLKIIVHGIKNSGELKIIEENLSSQEGIKLLKVSPGIGNAEIELEINNNTVTTQQVYDIIRIGGYFNIEERPVSNSKEGKPVGIKNKAESGSEAVYTPSSPGMITPRIYLAGGMLIGLLIASITLNILFGYLIYAQNGGSFKFASGNSQAAKQNTDTAVPKAGTQPANPAPSPEAGSVQTFTITKDDHIRGDFNAPVTLVEYSDFQCPYCARHTPTLDKILADYKGKVRLVYKHFPLSFHNNAARAAEASECAGEQNKFWEYHDKLFENQSSFSTDNFKKWAKDLKLNTATFNACLDSGKYTAKVQADEADGQARGVQGTPATFVNGKLISGAVPYDSFKSAIDQILKTN